VATETADEAVAAMVAAWLRLRAGAPDPHTQTAGLVMLAATNEQVARINDATQAVRRTQGELGPGATFGLPRGQHARFHVGDLVLIRRNDRHQQAVTGDAVLNGYRGVITALSPDGVEVAWRDPAAEPGAEPYTAVLSPAYIANGGLELGYALTAHKAEGLTVDGQWERPDGSRNHGSVLVYAPGLDNPGLYVSLSRDKGQALLFGARAELEGEREDLVYGPPRSQQELTDRVIAALADRAAATDTTANDRPVLVDLRQAPADPTQSGPQRQPEPSPVWVTDEQRRLWQELRERSVTARRAGDQDAYQAVQQERRALIEQLGPERVEVLRRETLEALRREVRDTNQHLERQRLIAQWQARVHGRLSDAELINGIRDAERRHAHETAAADRARQLFAELEPAVTAGRGPHVTQLDSELHRLRANAQLQRTAEETERRWHALRTEAGMAAARAKAAKLEAEQTHWWQAARRDRLQAQAAADNARAERAQAEAAELGRHVTGLQQQLGGPGAWRQARQQAQRAEASYEPDRRQAHQADQRELSLLRDRVTSHDTTATDASTHRDELQAEQRLRATMPDTQRTLEQDLRTQRTRQQRQQRLEHAVRQRQAARSVHNERDDHQRSTRPDINRGGPSPGR
jgi:hypothetical protein